MLLLLLKLLVLPLLTLQASTQCRLPSKPARGFDVTGCSTTNAPLTAAQCIVRCDSNWYFGQPLATCDTGNLSHPGEFAFSGCHRPSCPLQCAAGGKLLEEPADAALSALTFHRRSGVLLAADAGRHVVLSVDVRGVGAKSPPLSSVVFWGMLHTQGDVHGPALQSRLSRPAGLDIDARHLKLYVADTGNGKVRVLDLVTEVSTTIVHSLSEPRALAFHEDNHNLYICEYSQNGRVLRMDADAAGVVSAADLMVIASPVEWPIGLTIFEKLPTVSRLYIAEGGGNKRILEVPLNGGQVKVLIGGGSSSVGILPVGQFSVALGSPKGLAISLRSDRPTLFIADATVNGGRVLAAELSRAQSNCVDLGWEKGMEQGSPAICGHSYAKKGGAVDSLCYPFQGEEFGVTGLCCSGLVNWTRAHHFCEAQGARLCSAYEMERDEAREGYTPPTCKTGTTSYDDYYDEANIWTSTPCRAGRYGVNGFITRPGAREWSAFFPPQCAAVNNTAAYVKCCADSKMIMPVMGAQAPVGFPIGENALFQAQPSSVPTPQLHAAVAWDPLRQRLFSSVGNKLFIVSWTTPVTIVAGVGVAGHNGETMPAEDSELNAPLGLAWDDVTGSLFIADSFNNAVRKVACEDTFVMSAFAGSGANSRKEMGDGGLAIDAQLYQPHYLAVDHRQRGLYVSTAHHRVWFIDFATGSIEIVVNSIGDPGVFGDTYLGINAELNNPRGLSVVGNRLFISDRDNHKVRLYHTDTRIIETCAGPVLIPSAVSQSGDDDLGLVIYSLSTDPRVTLAKPPQDLMLIKPVGLAANALGSIVYIASLEARAIVHLDRVARPRRVRPVQATLPTIPNPNSLLLAPNGTLFATDHDLHVIFAFECTCTEETGCVARNLRIIAGNGTRGDGDPVRHRWTTTTTTMYTTTTTTTTTFTEIWCENHLLGPSGWDCKETCGQRNATCDPRNPYPYDFDSMQEAVERETGVTCIRDSRAFWGDFLPAFEPDEDSRNFGKCMGTYHMPPETSCTGKQTVYGSFSTTLRRWCHCIRNETGQCGQQRPTVTTTTTTVTTTTTTVISPFRRECPDVYEEPYSRLSLTLMSGSTQPKQQAIDGCAVMCELSLTCEAFIYNGESSDCYIFFTGYTQSETEVIWHETICIRSVSRAVDPDLSLEILLTTMASSFQMLNDPADMVMDAGRQLLYFCDSGNDKIKVIDLNDFTMVTVAGIGRRFPHYDGDGGLARDATLWNPQGLALDEAKGHLYVADTNNHVIRRIELGSSRLTGIIYRAAGDNIGSLEDSFDVLRSRFKYPWGIGLDTENSILYVSDSSNDKIRKVNFADNEVTTIMGDELAINSGDEGPALEAELKDPHAMLVTSGLNTAGGARELLFEEYPKQRVRSLNLMDDDNIVDTVMETYALDFTKGDGLLGVIPRDYDAEVSFPYGVAGTEDGQLYVSSYLYHRIRKIDLNSGLAETFAGTMLKPGFDGDGGPATSAKIDGPTDVDLDASGTNADGDALFIVEGDGGRVRRVSLSNDEISTLISLPPLQRLYGIAVDSVNQVLYVSSPTLHYVYRIALTGAVVLGDCTAPAGVANAASPACTEGDIVRVKACTPACMEGWLPTEETLACYDGVLLPPTFACEPGPCWAPSDIQHAAWPVACQEGRQIESGQNCTAMCAEGYEPDRNLACFAGVLQPTPTFQCCPVGGNCATTTTTITTTIQLIDQSNPVQLINNSGGISSITGNGIQVNTAGGWGSYLDIPEFKNLTVFGSFAFEVASFDLSMDEVTILGATETLQTPLQKALVSVFEVPIEDVHVRAVHAVTARRLSGSQRSLRYPDRFLQRAVHRVAVVYAITRAPDWVEPRVNSLGDSQSATGIQFAKALDSEGFATTLEQLSQNRDEPCQYPTGIQAAPLQSCEEGFGSAEPKALCTARCFTPRIPSFATLTCFAGIWSPTDTFECAEQQKTTISGSCALPTEIAGAADPPCAELSGDSASSAQWCTPVCQNNLVPSEIGLACLFGTLQPSTFQCRQPYCVAPTGISHAASNSCQEGNQISLGGQCTAICERGYKADANLTCERGLLSPPTFACSKESNSGGGDVGGDIWGPGGKLVTFSPPPLSLPSPGNSGQPSLQQPGDSSNEDSSGLGLMIVVIVLTGLMVICVAVGAALVIKVLRQRAHQAKIAEDWQDAMDHIGAGESDEPYANEVDNRQDEEEDESSNQEDHEGNALENCDDDGEDAEETSKQFYVEESANDDESIPDKHALQPPVVCVTPKRKAPRPPKVESLDCGELLRLAQETAVVTAGSTGDLSARSSRSRKSETGDLDEWFRTVQSAAAGARACDELFMNDTHRAALQRDAKFDALDDELAWSTNDDSRLHQLVGATPLTSLGLRINAKTVDDEGETEQPKLEAFSLASQLLVRPVVRPSLTESENSEAESTTSSTKGKSSRKKGQRVAKRSGSQQARRRTPPL